MLLLWPSCGHTLTYRACTIWSKVHTSGAVWLGLPEESCGRHYLLLPKSHLLFKLPL